jgi:hypothetical protein
MTASKARIASESLEAVLPAMLQEVRRHPDLTVETDTVELLPEYARSPQKLTENLRSHAHVEPDAIFERCFLPFTRFELQWQMKGSEAAGELSLVYLYSAVMEPPELSGATSSEKDRSVLESFRVIDDQPRSGRGTFAAVRASEGKLGADVWFFDVKRGTFELDLDYCSYLETLSVTKGHYGWQYLFADVDLAAPDHRRLQQDLRQMLKVLPKLFPGHDYDSLVKRLDGRSGRRKGRAKKPAGRPSR